MSNPSNNDFSSVLEKEPNTPQVEVLTSLGFGNPDAHISVVEKAKNPAQVEMMKHAMEIIASGEVLVPIDETDDGCIDGRLAQEISFVNPVTHESETKAIEDSTHERAKVAGGGYITTLAMYLGAKPTRSSAADLDLTRVGQLLSSEGVYCGAHTAGGSHPEGPGTGCGANDQVDGILKTALQFEDDVRVVAKDLVGKAGLKTGSDTIDSVHAKWEEVTADNDYFATSTGGSRFHVIEHALHDAQLLTDSEKPVGVSKDLAGSHQETVIVVNYCQGMTISQGKLNDLLNESFPTIPDSELPEAFVVDAWRIAKLASALARADKDVGLEAALYAGVAFQVATAATLTDGSLQVMTIK